MPSQNPSKFDNLFPTLCFFLFVIVSFGVGISVHYKLIPEQYYAKPWGKNAVTTILGIEVDTQWEFWVVFFIIMFLSALSSFVARSISIWEWELVNFSERKRPSEHKTTLNFFVVTFGGTTFLSVATILNLFFSVTSLYYLMAATLGRVCSSFGLSYVKGRSEGTKN